MKNRDTSSVANAPPTPHAKITAAHTSVFFYKQNPLAVR